MHKQKEHTHIHFVGIGGIGMSGIAEVFLNQGYKISGSDIAESDITRRLARLGVKISIGHDAKNINAPSVVVVSSAVKPTNLEVLEAKRLRIPVIPRAEMLGELMRGKTGIAVAGTHGKTTTTSMLATILTSAGLDPTLVIGGKVDSLGGNAKLGKGKLVVAEADESDGSFLHLPATYSVLTNIDNDHLDHFGSLSAVDDAFVNFVGKLPFYGFAAACGEDAGVRRCLGRFTKPVLTYGFSDEWDYFAADVAVQGLCSRFKVMARIGVGEPHNELGLVKLHIPGKHNILNALGAIAIAVQLDLPFSDIAKALSDFRGVKRRFEIVWHDRDKKRVIVDDYGHHPTEIAATLAAARTFWPGRIIVVFQPHRYTRTVHCKDGFLTAFKEADILFVTDIYPAGEDPIPGVESSSLVSDIRRATAGSKEILHVGDLAFAKETVLEKFSEGDLILCLGAGSITKLPGHLISVLGSAPQ